MGVLGHLLPLAPAQAAQPSPTPAPVEEPAAPPVSAPVEDCPVAGTLSAPSPSPQDKARRALEWLTAKGLKPVKCEGRIYFDLPGNQVVPDDILRRIDAIEAELLPLLEETAPPAITQAPEPIDIDFHLLAAQRIADHRNKEAIAARSTDRWCRCGWYAANAWRVSGKEIWRCDECGPPDHHDIPLARR